MRPRLTNAAHSALFTAIISFVAPTTPPSFPKHHQVQEWISPQAVRQDCSPGPLQLVCEVKGHGMYEGAVDVSAESCSQVSMLVTTLPSLLGLLHINWGTLEESLKKTEGQKICKLMG